MSRLLIAIATYNEADTIVDLLNEISIFAQGIDILVVDDSSVDGTGALVSKYSESYPNVALSTRPAKLGVGSAHLYAMLYAINKNYDYLITLDADFSHSPSYLPQFIEKLRDNDFVIGSRYVKGGECCYPLSRKILSRVANFAVRICNNVSLSETTTSYRGFSVKLIDEILGRGRLPEGYAFFFEIVRRVCLSTDRILEIPIVFEDRRAGKTKISSMEILRAFGHLVRNILGLHQEKRQNVSRKDNPCPCCSSIELEMRYPARIEECSTSVTDQRYACNTSVHQSRGGIADCSYCGNSFLVPQPSIAELEKCYVDVVDDEYVKNLSAREKTFSYNWRRVSKDVSKDVSTLLDIGSYCGVFLEVAKMDGLDVSGLEPSIWASNFCREHYGHRVIQGTSALLPFEDKSYDIITAWDVLEHVSSPIEFISKVNQSLETNGLFFFSTLNIDSWFPKMLGSRWPWYIDMHLCYFRKKTISKMLESQGFEVLQIQSYCHIITVEYFSKKLQALGFPGASIIYKIGSSSSMKNVKIPFKFGDIMLITCRKISKGQ